MKSVLAAVFDGMIAGSLPAMLMLRKLNVIKTVWMEVGRTIIIFLRAIVDATMI